MKICLCSSVAVAASVIKQRIEKRPCRYKSLLRYNLDDGRVILALGSYLFEQGIFIVYVRSYPLSVRTSDKLFKLAVDTDFPSLYDCVGPLE